jgi:hypothetical protein
MRSTQPKVPRQRTADPATIVELEDEAAQAPRSRNRRLRPALTQAAENARRALLSGTMTMPKALTWIR